jgi:hypothetical protein
MKIIFLDIDGVLNHQLWFEKINNAVVAKTVPTGERNYSRWFDPFCVELLNSLTTDTGAVIVVSSSWRKGRTVKELQELFKAQGITGKVIDKTPVLHFKGPEGYSYSVPRGCEIKAWLEINKGILGQKIGSFDKYVIFDDDSDMLWWQRNNFFHVDGYCGLTPNLIYKATNFLNR